METPATPSGPLETFQLGPLTAPRVFTGLWQTSSPAWGTASKQKILRQFKLHADAGLNAFDMADLYGDAELLFGRFRSTLSDPRQVICATKYIVMETGQMSQELITSVIDARLKNTRSESIDLLQFHWQDYNDKQYIPVLKMIENDPRVTVVGLCNFDTERLEEIVESGVKVATNQVQFSLIDSRPTFKMGAACQKYNVKLLTYGTLCGGFLAEKWLNKPEPIPFEESMTPSHRKYLAMINLWGGWELFQKLLAALHTIAQKHSVSVSNVATRWVLDHEYVGAVIVGARMGISEHVQENLAVYGWKLDEEDQTLINAVQEQSKREELFVGMGDCAGEFRQ